MPRSHSSQPRALALTLALAALLLSPSVILAAPADPRARQRSPEDAPSARGAAKRCSVKSGSSSAAVVTDAQVLVAGDDGQSGHWLVYTTSTFINDGASPTASPNPIDQVVNPSHNFVGSICPGYGVPCVENPAPSSTSMAFTDWSQSSSGAAPPPSSAASPMSAVPTSMASSAAPTALAASSTGPGPSPAPTTSLTTSAGGGTTNPAKQVFAHFMVGIVSTYAQQDWVNDMQLAKSKGISGFALNIGVDPYTQSQLDLAYAAAESVGDFVLFISFDFNWYTVGDTGGVASMMGRYVGKTAQFLVDGKPFVSSFIGDGFDWAGVASQIGREIYALPFWQPSAANAQNAGVAGSFSWAAWPGQLNNVPILANMTDDRDELYLGYLKDAGKQYMMPVSPWFSTHFGHEVSYSKNWVFYSEELWKTRWDEVLELGAQGVNFVEIVTWNDYGESHYIGPFNTPHTDDGSSRWASGLDHTAMLDFSVPYIEAFKQGATEPIITNEMLVYWHRPHLKDVSCDSTDNCGSRPTGADFVEDSVFVATMTTQGGSVTVNSGSNAAYTMQVDAGVQIFQVPMGVGQQAFKFQTTAGKSGSGTSNVSVLDTCWNGIYNFNFHSGSIS